MESLPGSEKYKAEFLVSVKNARARRYKRISIALVGLAMLAGLGGGALAWWQAVASKHRLAQAFAHLSSEPSFQVNGELTMNSGGENIKRAYQAQATPSASLITTEAVLRYGEGSLMLPLQVISDGHGQTYLRFGTPSDEKPERDKLDPLSKVQLLQAASTIDKIYKDRWFLMDKDTTVLTGQVADTLNCLKALPTAITNGKFADIEEVVNANKQLSGGVNEVPGTDYFALSIPAEKLQIVLGADTQCTADKAAFVTLETRVNKETGKFTTLALAFGKEATMTAKITYDTSFVSPSLPPQTTSVQDLATEAKARAGEIEADLQARLAKDAELTALLDALKQLKVEQGGSF